MDCRNSIADLKGVRQYAGPDTDRFMQIVNQ